MRRQIALLVVVALLAAASAVATAAAKPDSSKLPDAALASLSLSPSSAPAGGAVTATDAVRNAGRAPLRGVSVRFWLATTPKLTAKKPALKPVLLGRRIVRGKLAARKRSGAQTALGLPRTLKPGAYYVIACASAKGRQRTKANDCRAARLQVTAPATGGGGTGAPVGGASGGPAAGAPSAGGNGGGSSGGGSDGGGTPPPPPPPPPPPGDEGSLILSPAGATTHTVNGAHQVTATLANKDGSPRKAQQIAFAVTGANPASAVRTTDAQGHATFAYTGLNTGADTITATSATLQSKAATVTWAAPPVGVTAPTIGTPSPADGARIGAPTPVSAAMTPAPGTQLASWSVVVAPRDGGAPRTIANGTGAPPSPLGTIDPTLLPNGPYTLTISALDADGGAASQAVSFSTIGALKLGRFVSVHRDLTLTTGSTSVGLERRYDSTDKTTHEFGTGWKLSFSGDQVATNTVFGAGGGWSETLNHCNNLAFRCWYDLHNSAARFVTITAPDGTTQVFDQKFQVSGSSVQLFGDQTGTAAFTPRADTGTTGTLEVVDKPDIVFTIGGHDLKDKDGNPYDPKRFKLTRRDGTVEILDADQGLISVTDTDGNQVTVDGAGVHSSDGRSITFDRDAEGRVTKAHGPGGKDITYTYGGAGDLTKVVDADGRTTTYTYDLGHNLLKSEGPGQPLRTLDYDDNGRLVSITDALGHKTTVASDPSARTQTYTDALGTRTTVLRYDAQGNLTGRDVIADGKTLSWAYTYDAAGRRLTATDPLNHTTTAEYDAAGDLTSLTDADGVKLTMTYDAAGHPLSQAVNNTTLQTASYDAKGHLTQLSRPVGGPDTFTYDSKGRMATAKDALNKVTTFAYGADGMLASITDPLNHATGYGYDGAANLATVTDALTHDSTFATDTAGNVTDYTDADNAHWQYGYDAVGRPSSVTDPLGHKEQATYDAAGRLESTTDRNGIKLTRTYDADGQLTKVSGPEGDVTYDYDGFGRVVAIRNSTERLTFAYDDAGRITAAATDPPAGSDLPTATIQYGWTPGDRLHTVDGPGGNRTYTYDAAGRLAGVQDPDHDAFAFSYNAAGWLTGLTRPNGVADTLTYDAAARLTGRDAKKGATTLARADYAHDAAGRRTSLTDAAGTSTYTHDANGRITAATHPAGEGAAESYSYDNAGYRISDAGHPGPFAVDAAGRLLDDGRFTYTYDDAGNLTRKVAKAGGATTTYDWDQFGRLAAVHLPGGDVLHYAYDPLGRRVRSDGPAGVHATVWNGPNALAAYDGAGHLTAAYTTTQELDEVLEVKRGADRLFPLVDAQRSEIAETDATGAVTGTAAYDTFGAAHVLSGTLALGFLGRPAPDASGLIDLRARVADPTTGRFLSEDPEWGTDLYNYAFGNPVDQVDRNGRSVIESGDLEGEATATGDTVGETLANNTRAQVRTEARNIWEDWAMQEAENNPGTRIMEGKIKDPRYPEDVWAKMEHIHNHPGGSKTVIHFWENLQTGLRHGFKFK